MQKNEYRKYYHEIMKNRLQLDYTLNEKDIIRQIQQVTEKKNIDNISRTNSYIEFYNEFPEIKWAFLASMVSRNAGWNMTDLKGKWFPKILSNSHLHHFFLTYERANWLIFHDVYPQLLLYKVSRILGFPLFHLFKAFYVSTYMEIEWQRFWKRQDQSRLMNALIINEQHVIQKPVIEHPFFKKNVFKSLTFQFQDWFHFSQVLFPTVEGELYGFSTYDFRNVFSRIELGKRLAWLLFHPDYYDSFYTFSKKTTHTGSRKDYEQYFPYFKEKETPFLRLVFPVIRHSRHDQHDWFHGQSVEKLQKKPKIPSDYLITEWYKKKQLQLQIGILSKMLLK